MDFTLSSEQQEWRQRARDFADQVVRPVAAELDARKDPADSFSWDLVEAADEWGLRACPLEPPHGAGTDFLTNTVMLEEIATADMGTAVVLAQNWKFHQWINELASEDQKKRWLPALTENKRSLMAAALTEPAPGGSDNMLPYNGQDGGLKTSAVRRDGGWVLNGMKHYISNSNRANVLIIFGRTDQEQGVVDGCTAFILSSDTPGLRIGKVHDKTGERLANNAEIFLENVFVPDEDRFGDEGTALKDVARLLRGSNAYAAACTLGVAQEAFNRAMEWCGERVGGGKVIIEHDSVGDYLADMYTSLDVARTYTRRAAWAADHQEVFDTKLAVIPKLFASEVSFEVTRKALELFGGAGIMRDVGMEKLLRDAAIFLHSDGTNIIMRKKLATMLRAERAVGATEKDKQVAAVDV